MYISNEDLDNLSILYDDTYASWRSVPLDNSFNPIRIVLDYSESITNNLDSNIPNNFILKGAVLGSTSDNPNFYTSISWTNYGSIVNVDYTSLGYVMRFVKFFISKRTINNRPSVVINCNVYGSKLPLSSNSSIDIISSFEGISYFDYWGSSEYDNFFDTYDICETWVGAYANGSIGKTYQDGYNEGVASAQKISYDKGYNDGMQVSWGKSAISDMITTIVQSPVTFIQSVFNVDVFGFNLSGIIFMIISISVYLFVFSIALKFIGKI